MPGSNSTSTPLTLALGIPLLRRSQRRALNVGLAAAIVGDARFDFGTEVAEQALDRPGRRVAQGADGVPFDLGGDFQKDVDLLGIGLALGHPLHHPPHPAGAFAARRALAAAL